MTNTQEASSLPHEGAFNLRLTRPGLAGFVARRPLLCFFVLSLLLSWSPVALSAVGGPAGTTFGAGPFLAAVIVLALSQGRSGVRDLLARMIRWRVVPQAYVAALGLPSLITAAAIGANLAIGAPTPLAADLTPWTQFPLLLALMLLVPLFGAWEEPGFRGYALERLERRFGLLAAPLLLGVFWAFWHLPLFLKGEILWPDGIVIVAASVVIAAVYHLGSRSILIVMLMHATNNTMGEFTNPLWTGPDAVHLNLLVAAIWVLLATAILIRHHLPARRTSPTSPTSAALQPYEHARVDPAVAADSYEAMSMVEHVGFQPGRRPQDLDGMTSERAQRRLCLRNVATVSK
jgi:membrane protease YdiL (CAAX protease family)